MTSAFKCPACDCPLQVERELALVILFCGNSNCPSGSTANDGASAQTEQEAYYELKDLIDDE